MGTMDTSIHADTRMVGTHEGMRRTRVSYLSNGMETGIILSVPMSIHRHLLVFS
jgi:hypothetical protein